MFVTTHSLQRDPVINRIFDVLGSLNGDSTQVSWVPPVAIFEDAEGIRIMAEVPGVKPEDVKISLEHNVLTIKGSKQQMAEERTERVRRDERSYGTFERSFTLPATVDPSNIKATYEHGVLTVTLPKAERAKARQIEVQVVSK
jgi:HSP20 family protein